MHLLQILASVFPLYTVTFLEPSGDPSRSKERCKAVQKTFIPKSLHSTVSMVAKERPPHFDENDFLFAKAQRRRVTLQQREHDQLLKGHNPINDPMLIPMPLRKIGDRAAPEPSTTEPVIVGIAGGSASGKTTLTTKIIEALGDDHVNYICHDNYYKDLSHLSIEERAKINFDHPDSLDTALLIEHLKRLRRGETVEIPTYDFATHTRAQATVSISPSKIVVIDGILIFSEPKLLELMDMKIFVDTDDDIRLIRRIERDTKERNRSVSSVISQYVNTVRPMHQLFVEPSKRQADIIVPAGQGTQTVALEMCVSRLREIINFYQ